MHSHPEQEEQMYRDYDRRAYATIAELEAYDRLTHAMNASAAKSMRMEPEDGKTGDTPRRAGKRAKNA